MRASLSWRVAMCLEPVEWALDAPAKLVETFAKAERLLAVAAVRNDRPGSPAIQPFSQFGAAVGVISEHAFGRLDRANEAFGDRAVVCDAACQEDGEKASFSICECVNLSTCTIPLMTRRSSTLSIPRTSVGKCGSIRAHCSSLSQNKLRRMIPIPCKTNHNRMESGLSCVSTTIIELES